MYAKIMVLTMIFGRASLKPPTPNLHASPYSFLKFFFDHAKFSFTQSFPKIGHRLFWDCFPSFDFRATFGQVQKGVESQTARMLPERTNEGKNVKQALHYSWSS